MALKCDDYQGVCVLTAEGDLVGDDVATLRGHVDDAVDRQIVDLVIDLAQCPYADSAGLEALTWMRGRCDELFGRLVLAAADDALREILDLTRLSAKFEFAADVESALKNLR
jgi:anti-anti-sigma factor